MKRLFDPEVLETLADFTGEAAAAAKAILAQINKNKERIERILAAAQRGHAQPLPIHFETQGSGVAKRDFQHFERTAQQVTQIYGSNKAHIQN